MRSRKRDTRLYGSDCHCRRTPRLPDNSSGAITGVVARLERAGYLRRRADPNDQRRQILSPVQERVRRIEAVFAPIKADMCALLNGFDARQLEAVAEFLERSTEHVYRHAALLRGEARSAPRVRKDEPGAALSRVDSRRRP